MGENKNKTCCTRSRGMSARATASGNSSARRHHWQRQGRWEFGEHETFGSCDVGGCPCSTPRSSWSLRPPAPAAGRTKTVKIILQQDRGGCGNERVASRNNKHPAQAPKKKNAPHPLKHPHSLCPHPRGTQRSVAPKTPRGQGGMGKFSTFRHGREGLAARLTVGLVRGSNVGGPGAHPQGTRVSIGVRACSPDSEVCPHGPWLIAR